MFQLGPPLTVSELITQSVLRYKGKITADTVSTTPGQKVLGIANFYLRQFAREPDVDWAYFYDPEYAVGNITATDTFDLDDEVLKISQQQGDVVRITSSAGQQYDYDLVAADRLKDYPNGNYAAVVGRTIKFNRAFTADDAQFGGALTIPVYLAPSELTAANDEVELPDPNWLVLIVAAELSRTDITRQAQYPNLIAETNEVMRSLKQDNDTQVNEVLMPWSPTSGMDSSDTLGGYR